VANWTSFRPYAEVAANNIAITYSAHGYIIRIINKREGFTAISVNYSRAHANYIIYIYYYRNIQSRRKVQCVLIDWRAYLHNIWWCIILLYTCCSRYNRYYIIIYHIYITYTHGENNIIIIYRSFDFFPSVRKSR